MAKTTAKGLDARFLLQLVVGVFFIVIGLDVLINYNSTLGKITMGLSKLFGNTDYVLQIIIAILELVAGIVIIGALFVPLDSTIFNLSILIVFILWLVRIVYIYFISKKVFDPNTITWLKDIALDAIVLASVWVIKTRYNE